MSQDFPITTLVNSKASTVSTTCTYCGVGCGIDIDLSIDVDHFTFNGLKGTEDHGANHGRLCVKGSNLLSTLDQNSRLTHAYIEDKQVSVDEATTYVAAQFEALIKQYGKNAVAIYASGQLLTEDYYVANKLMKGYIGTANIDTNSRLCMSSAVSAYKRAFGEDIVPCSYHDLEYCDLLVLTGSNMAWTHPVLFQRIERARKKNPQMTVVCLDPRKTATTKLADIHIPLAPGSDAGFFNGLLCYLSAHKKINTKYIKDYCEQFEEVNESIKPWNITSVADFCQVESSTIETVYQLFSKKNNVVTLYSMGVNQSTSGTDKCNTIINCHLATGKIGTLGNGPFSITGQPNAMGGREVGGLANQLTAHLELNNPLHRETVQRFWQSPEIADEEGANAIEMFKRIESGQIKAIWIMATNPAVSMPDHNNVVAALKKCPLVVVSDCVKNNDTLALANVKLPASAWLEKNGTVTNSERRISRQRGVIKPLGEACHDWQLICSVARKMGFIGFDYSHPSEIFTEFAKLTGHKSNHRAFDISALATLNKASYDKLKPMQWPINAHNPDGCQHIFADNVFYTSTGKAQFIAVEPTLPTYNKSSQYTYIVNSGRIRDQWHTMTRTGNTHKLFTTQDSPYVSINPLDAKQHQIYEGALVKVSNDIGEVIMPVKFDNDVQAGHLFVPIHWNNQFASNATVSSLYQGDCDPISKQPQLKQTKAMLSLIKHEQYIQFYTTRDITLNTDYWHKITGDNITSYYAANEVFDNYFISSLKAELSGEWYSFITQDTQYYLVTSLKKLLGYIVVSTSHRALNNAWLEAMSEKSLSFADIQSLIIGQPSDEFMQGKIVCSCFEVREKSIISEVRVGYNNVESLGRKLHCGTKCGSCKPELQQYINQHSGNSTKTVKLPEVIDVETISVS